MARWSSRRARALKKAIDRRRASERTVVYDNVEIVLETLDDGTVRARLVAHSEPKPGADYSFRFKVFTYVMPGHLLKHLGCDARR